MNSNDFCHASRLVCLALQVPIIGIMLSNLTDPSQIWSVRPDIKIQKKIKKSWSSDKFRFHNVQILIDKLFFNVWTLNRRCCCRTRRQSWSICFYWTSLFRQGFLIQDSYPYKAIAWGQLPLGGQIPGLELEWQIGLLMQTHVMVKRFILISEIFQSQPNSDMRMYCCSFRKVWITLDCNFDKSLQLDAPKVCSQALCRVLCLVHCPAVLLLAMPAHGSLRTRHEGICMDLFKLQKCSSWMKKNDTF